MPIIKCTCSLCGHSFHELVRWGQLRERDCPCCGKLDVKVKKLDVMKECPRFALSPLQAGTGHSV